MTGRPVFQGLRAVVSCAASCAGRAAVRAPPARSVPAAVALAAAAKPRWLRQPWPCRIGSPGFPRPLGCFPQQVQKRAPLQQVKSNINLKLSRAKLSKTKVKII